MRTLNNEELEEVRNYTENIVEIPCGATEEEISAFKSFLTEIDEMLEENDCPEIAINDNQGIITLLLASEVDITTAKNAVLERHTHPETPVDLEVNSLLSIVNEFWKGNIERGWTSRSVSSLANATGMDEEDVLNILEAYNDFTQNGSRWTLNILTNGD